MHRLSLTLLGLVAMSGLCRAQGDPTKKPKDGKAIQGIWKMEKVWENGKLLDPTSKDGRLVWTITADQMTLHDPVKNEVEEKVSFKLDPKQKPAAIDFTVNQDVKRESRVMGIYEIKGDTMQICFAKDQRDRPKKFESAKGSKHTFVILKREKKK